MVETGGTKYWYKNGKLHKKDGPAVEYPNGGKEWWLYGMKHRDDGSAVEYPNDTCEYWKNGKLITNNDLKQKKLMCILENSVCGINRKNGNIYYCHEKENKEGKKSKEFHRENDPAIEMANGDKYWCQNGEFHRKNAPAIEYNNGDKFWYKNGKLHRLCGPAVEYAGGGKEYWLEGERVTKVRIEKYIKSPKENDLQQTENRGKYVLELFDSKSKVPSKFYYKNKDKKFVLHRDNNKPAIERSNGDKEWYKDGRLHREDGPAKECSNGYKEWRISGRKHRENGPAIEHINGDKEYWYTKYNKKGEIIENYKHRLDGPAIERINGCNEWYIKGRRQNDPIKNPPNKEGLFKTKHSVTSLRKNRPHNENGPATTHKNGDKTYNINGKLHRDNGPAIDWSNKKKWYKNGILHRDNGPAIEYGRGPNKWCLWYENGLKHRDNGPAVICTNGYEKWYKDNKIHRNNGPAITHSDGTKMWYKDGLRHRDDGPAIEWANGDKVWYKDGKIHREDGPAVIYSDKNKVIALFERPEFKKIKTSSYEVERNKKGEKNNYIVIKKQIKNLEYKEERWYKNGKLHREDGPAVIINNDKYWYKNGRKHRLNDPAIELANGNKYWYKNGKLHKEDGPAKIIDDGAQKQWYVNGKFIKETLFE